MSFNRVVSDLIEERLLNLQTAFVGQIIALTSEDKCTIQPLDKIKAYGQEAKSQAPITNVPILSHVKHYKLVEQSLTVSEGSLSPAKHGGHLEVTPLQAGDIVLCVCASRDISSSIKGFSTVPPVGHHQIGSAIVVGLIGG